MSYENKPVGAGGSGAATAAEATLEPSLRNALTHYTLLAVFPSVVISALYGGWWILGPFLFFWLANAFDDTFGLDERNTDPLVDQWRQQLYPQVDNWEVYDSPAFAARPDAFEAIAEILSAAPGRVDKPRAGVAGTPERKCR